MGIRVKYKHELPQINHELNQKLLMDNSCIIHGNSCKNKELFMSFHLLSHPPTHFIHHIHGSSKIIRFLLP